MNQTTQFPEWIYPIVVSPLRRTSSLWHFFLRFISRLYLRSSSWFALLTSPITWQICNHRQTRLMSCGQADVSVSSYALLSPPALLQWWLSPACKGSPAPVSSDSCNHRWGFSEPAAASGGSSAHLLYNKQKRNNKLYKMKNLQNI